MNTDSNLALLQSAAREDANAVNELLQRHTEWLWGYVRKHMGSGVRRFETSADLVQDTLRKLLEQGPHFLPRDDGEFRRLVAKIVLNRIIDLHRWGRHPGRAVNQAEEEHTVTQIGPLERSDQSPSRVLERNEEEARARLALELCDPDDAYILKLRFWDELSFEEIASRLEIQANAARMRANRARLKLGAMIRRLESGELDDIASDLD